jgi:hypothetical protein
MNTEQHPRLPGAGLSFARAMLAVVGILGLASCDDTPPANAYDFSVAPEGGFWVLPDPACVEGEA